MAGPIVHWQERATAPLVFEACGGEFAKSTPGRLGGKTFGMYAAGHIQFLSALPSLALHSFYASAWFKELQTLGLRNRSALALLGHIQL